MESNLLRARSEEGFELKVLARWSFEREVQIELASSVQSVLTGSQETTLDLNQVNELSLAMNDTQVVVHLKNIVPAFIHLAAGVSRCTSFSLVLFAHHFVSFLSE